MSDIDRWQPVPVPEGDGRHDIGDDVRAAIVQRLTSDWGRDRDLTPEKVRQLAIHEHQQDHHRTAVFNMGVEDPFNRAALEVMKVDGR